MDKYKREKVYKKFDSKCVFCGRTKTLHVHHINTNRSDNRLCNLLLVCKTCHLKCHGRKSHKKRHLNKIRELYASGLTIYGIQELLGIEERGEISSYLTSQRKRNPWIFEEHNKNWPSLI